MGLYYQALREGFDLQPELVRSIMLSLVIVLLLTLMRVLVLRIVYRNSEDVRVRYQWRKTVGYTSVGLGLLFLAGIWLEAFESIGTFLGLLSAGLTIALKDLVTGMAGWVFILWRRPFEVGDRIQIGNNCGDVIDIRVFQFTLLEIGNWVDADQSTGRIVHIPNGRVLSDVVANYSKGFQFIWNEIPVVITFESDWQLAKSLLVNIVRNHAEQLSHEAQEQVRRAAQKFMIFYTKLTPTVYTSVKDNGVMLTVRYLCRPQNRRGSEETIWEEILTQFAPQTTIDFAYPTQRFFDHRHEGKPVTSAGPEAGQGQEQ